MVHREFLDIPNAGTPYSHIWTPSSGTIIFLYIPLLDALEKSGDEGGEGLAGTRDLGPFSDGKRNFKANLGGELDF